MRTLFLLLALGLTLTATQAQSPVAPGWADAPMDAGQAHRLFTQAWTMVHDHFFDPHFHGVDWDAERTRYEARLGEVHTRREFRHLINQMLGDLKTSHTELYGPDEDHYYVLAATFGSHAENFPKSIFTGDNVLYDNPGLEVEAGARGVFVLAVMEGTPADKAGFKVGDRIVTVNRRPWRDDAWNDTAEHAVPVQIQRHENEAVQTLMVTPKRVNPTEQFMEAMKASARIISAGEHLAAYVHVWAFTSPRVVSLMSDLLQGGRFQYCDRMIMDLRDGIGGGFFEFFMPWGHGYPRITFVDRDGYDSFVPPKPLKPMVVLINQGSRSAKEIYAWGFKHYHEGTLIGTRTATAVVGGRAYYLEDGSLLYLAVAKVLVDGEDLEGRGVSPDIEVQRPIPYADGKDPQMESALQLLQR